MDSFLCNNKNPETNIYLLMHLENEKRKRKNNNNEIIIILKKLPAHAHWNGVKMKCSWNILVWKSI